MKIDNIQEQIQKTLEDRRLTINQKEACKFDTAMTQFVAVSEESVRKILIKAPIKSCELDPLPALVLRKCEDVFIRIITLIVNRSFEEGVMPTDFKLAVLIPLLKKIGLERLKKNFRPISNLPYASKIIERAAADQIVQHMITNGLHEPLQSAYKQFHSCETALLTVQNDILMAMDKQQVSILLLLDLSAAFDTVNHNLLLRRLSDRCGIQGHAYKWLESYLSERFQMVRIKSATSKKVQLTCGVPQGSVLGPLLFTIYTLPLGDLIRERYNMNFHLYADDTQLYMAFTPTPADAEQCTKKLENCVHDIHDWMLCNSLKLNSDKTEMLVIGTRQQHAKVQGISIKIDRDTIEPKDEARNLGVIFDKYMTLKAHVNALCKSARYYLHNINVARRYLTTEAAEKAIHAFVVSQLDGTNSLLYGLPAIELKKLQKIQNSAARMLTGASKYDHITPVLK